MKNLYLLIFIFSIGEFSVSHAQGLVINEVSSSNSSLIYDEDGDTPDWIELFNGGISPINLEGYGLSDTLNNDLFWNFPAYELASGGHLLVFASDKDRKDPPLNWETIIDAGETWKYLVPAEEPDAAWRLPGFDESSWLDGKTSIGYGDDDDSTVVEGATSVFLRKTFNINDPAAFHEAILHVDYDDGFIAYINGVEVARNGFTSESPIPYDAFSEISHEAKIFNGGQPEAFFISSLQDILVTGENILSVQVHNTSAGSSDLTIIPILSLGATNSVSGGLSDYVNFSPKSFHTHFKISSDGETIYLKDPLGDLVDTLYTGKLISNISIGRSPDGQDNIVYFQEPTPGDSNLNQAYQNFAGNVSFSLEGGFYTQQITLEIQSENPDDTIYYTIDGKDPNENSSKYKNPLQLSFNTVVKARVLKYNSVPGLINSQSYFFNTTHDLPLISIVTDPKNFFDFNTGIYMKGPNAESEFPYFGANFWEDWEVPVHIEMFEPNGEQAFSLNAGAKIFGAYSRGSDQKSLTIHARKSYGDGPIEYKIFDEKKLDEFSSIVLRNSGNDWNNTMFRDGLLTSLFAKNVDRQAFRPAVVYINGDYWGIHNIREKINEHFVADNHNLDSDDINLVELNGQPVFGDEGHYVDMINYISSHTMTNQQSYEYIKTQMDVLNFINYEIGNIFIDNTDWPGNNVKYWRHNSDTAVWRWIIYDTDFGFGIWEPNNVNNNTLEFALDPYGPGWPNPSWSTLLLRKLIENTEFKSLFINSFADQLNTNLLPANVRARIDYHKNLIESEINAHMSRWGGSIQYWNQQVNALYTFANQRPNVIRNNIKSRFGISSTYQLRLEVSSQVSGKIRLNTIIPESYSWTGTYFTGIPITLTALPNPGYRFVRWEGDVASTDETVTVTLSANSTVRAVFEEFDSELTSIIVNEINYNSDNDFDPGDWIELYNKSVQNFDLSGWEIKDDDDDHSFLIPDGTIIPGNGYLVVCSDQEAFNVLFPNVSQYVGDMDFGLSSDGDCVRLFTDEGVLVENVCYENTSPWPEEANGTGATLALRHYDYDNAEGRNWYALQDHGNPGEDNTNAITGLAEGPLDPVLFVYPNPIGQISQIQYFTHASGFVNLSIFDNQGRLLEVLVNNWVEEGEHGTEWSRSDDMHSGIYFIKLVGTKGVQIRKVILK